MRKRTIRDLDPARIRGRVILTRVDFNVPLEDGKVTDDTRIEATLPTLRWLVQCGGRVVLVSHLGRPKGKVDDAFTLAPVARRLSELIRMPVRFVEAIAGERVTSAIESLEPGGLLLLENVRFDPGEESNDPRLAEALAALADVYVNDAFGTAHRAHASTHGVAEVMKRAGKPAVAGLLIQKELEFLGGALDDPRRPFIAILGGAKISGKIDVIESLLPRADALLIGGAMANTFFRGLGLETGRSLVEEDRVPLARELLRRAGPRLLLPVDCVVAKEATADATQSVVPRDAVPADARILDLGPKSAALFAERIMHGATVLWNGPVGLFEIEPFATGTRAIAEAVARSTVAGATTIVGGGDTAAALEQSGKADAVSHLSTGGGASLEFLEGKPLPGIVVLDDA
ncbi:MAG: phosphoglycerate kinase [Longimicrobiales bacterium]